MQNTRRILFDTDLAQGVTSIKEAADGLDKTLRSLQQHLGQIFGGFTLSQYLQDALKASGQLDKELLVMRLALGKLRVAIGEAFAPIGQVVLPLLNDAIFASIRFVKSAGKIIRALFGIEGSAADAAEAEYEYGTAISTASRSAQRSLASFDKLNRLQKQTGSGSVTITPSISTDDKLNLQETLIFNTLYEMLAPLKEIDLSPITNGLKALKEALRPINKQLFDGLQWAWDEIFVPIIQWSAEILLPKVIETLAAALETLDAVIESCKPALSYLWENFLKPLGQWAGEYLLGQLDSLQGKLQNIERWASAFPVPAEQIVLWLDNITGGMFNLTDLFEQFNGVGNESSNVLGGLGGKLGSMMSPLDSLTTLFGEVCSGLSDWNFSWLSAADSSDLASFRIKNSWKDFSGWFDEKVLTPFEKSFGESGRGLLGIVGGVSSGATSGINTLIRGINQIKFTIPEWVPLLGGKKIDFSIPLLTAPQIPQLAKGAVLPANKPFLAMVGDQRHGTNVEAPLTTIQEAVRLELQDLIDSNLSGQETIAGVLRQILEAVLGISISDTQIAMAADRYQSKMAVVHGSFY